MGTHRIDLLEHGIFARGVLRNPSRAKLYEDAVAYDGGCIADSGAMVALSHAKTGRSPKDKRIVEEAASQADVWWGKVNIPLSKEGFTQNRRRAVDYLSHCQHIYVIDGYVGWAPEHRLKVRIVCSRPYHALFMQNMMIRPTEEELAEWIRTRDAAIELCAPKVPLLTEEGLECR